METVNAVPVLVYFVCLAGLSVVLLGMGALFTPRQFVGPVQKMPYESGMDPIHDTRRRFDVRFHLIAIAFLVFDVEVLFLYPWAVAAKRPEPVAVADAAKMPGYATPEEAAEHPVSVTMADLKANPEQAASTGQVYNISSAVADGLASDRNVVFGGAAVFFVLLALGFIYDWRKGVFSWR